MSSFKIFDVIDFDRSGDRPQAAALDFDEEHPQQVR